MAYSLSRGGFDRSPRRYNNNNGYQNYQRQAKKRTGCKSGQTKTGKPYIQAWNASKRHGLLSIIAGPYKGTKTSESRSGKRWQNWAVKVQPERSASYMVSGMYDMQGGRLIIQELGMVANPRTRYFGTFTRKTR